jgi:predicted hydrolase (HD superfamily)
MLYSAYILEELAVILKEDPHLWFLTGLFHDIDLEHPTYNDSGHGLIAETILNQEGIIDSKMIAAIKLHNAELNRAGVRESLLDFALSAGESVSGLISAMAVILPDKKIESVKIKSLKKRMKEKAFARNVNRENILECEKLGLELNNFFQIALNGMIRATNHPLT